MEPKTELLVFNKKEISVIIVLLVLVAMFSFTLGLRLGKSLGSHQSVTHESTEQAPLDHKQDGHGEAAEHKDEHGAAPAGDAHGEHKEGHQASSGAADHKPVGDDAAAQSSKAAEDQADAEFVAEASKEKVKASKGVVLALPKDKKSEGFDGPRYTLQVGSHRTVAEAAEQVALLKRSNLDAFYMEAKVPGKGTWYRVGIGLFKSKEEAESTAGKWKAVKKGLPSYIVQKINE